MTHAHPGDLSSPLDDICAEIAAAAQLQEGAPGVLRILLAIKGLTSASTRAVSRLTKLPLPVVAAVNGELRRRALLTNDRPSTLTSQGRQLLESLDAGHLDATCVHCQGAGLTIPPELADVSRELHEAMAQIPPVEAGLDQSHCTVETKLRRVLVLVRDGVLPTRSLVLLGDDDIMALTVDLVGRALGFELAETIGVVDTSPAILAFLRERLAAAPIRFEFAEHDLREPLPESWQRRFDVAMTDPPYTESGAELFLSRAVDALRPGPGNVIAFSYGHKGPAEAAALADKLYELGLVIAALRPDFNRYHGAGAIGGRSNLYRLVTSDRTRPTITGRYDGPLYTADKRGATRWYLCLHCRARLEVGPGARWPTVEVVRAAGCPECGQHRLRPLTLTGPSAS